MRQQGPVYVMGAPLISRLGDFGPQHVRVPAPVPLPSVKTSSGMGCCDLRPCSSVPSYNCEKSRRFLCGNGIRKRAQHSICTECKELWHLRECLPGTGHSVVAFHYINRWLCNVGECRKSFVEFLDLSFFFFLNVFLGLHCC